MSTENCARFVVCRNFLRPQNFWLRGKTEHAQLQTGQFIFGEDDNGNYVEFQERQVKTNQGGLKHRKLNP